MWDKALAVAYSLVFVGLVAAAVQVIRMIGGFLG